VHALLEAGLMNRLTLLSAPPGAGKTVALLTWLDSRGDRDLTAWLPLSELDNNPLAFWHRIATAVAGARGDSAPVAETNEAALVATLFAALEDDGPFVDRFDESERAVSDYLVHEVLARQDGPTREFLLKTALCRRVCGELANALTGENDGERTLAELERRNLFISHEPGTPWYRYHRLFAELLRAEASYEFGDEEAAVHADAANWLAANGLALEALAHAAACADGALAARLVGSLWAQIGGERQLEVAKRLVGGMPLPADEIALVRTF